MPHQCTNCGRTFDDGSKEMLSGCPDCSGTKFQFQPGGFDDADPPSDPELSEASSGSDRSGDGPSGDAVSRTVGSAASTVRDLVAGSAGPDATSASPPSDGGGDDDIIVAESEPVDESHAQADARSQVAGPDEVPGGPGLAATDADDETQASDEETVDSPAEPDGTDPAAESAGTAGPSEDDASTGGSDRSVADEPDTERSDRPDLAQLREELNEQFESIRVVEPGQYELNLMELYDREEYIIALQEDGRYSIQVPETWREADV